MKIEFRPLSPNPREKFHKKVKAAAEILCSQRDFLFDIANFVTSNSSSTYPDKSLNDNYTIRLLRKRYPADINFNNLIGELSALYNDKNNLDHFRGALLEVFISCLCAKKYGLTNIYVEAIIEVDGWKTSCPIDVGAHRNKRNGVCFECKVDSPGELYKKKNIKNQVDNLKNVMQNTNNKFKGIIATFADKAAFEMVLARSYPQVKLGKIDIFGRTQLINDL